jgi:hypothetical protein
MAKIEVVDTNVWASIDKIPPANATEAACVKACFEWGKQFSEAGEDYKIAVDMAWKILTEYRGQIKKGGLAEQYLNRILSQPVTRIEFAQIEFDENGHAILEENIMDDPSDRKFVAVALTFDPIPPILNAMDSDWAKSAEKLAKAGIVVEELCLSYIQSKIELKGS